MTEIPDITDPLGKYWRQPSKSDILVDDLHAVVTRKTFNDLLDYTQSQPTGVYLGKMWKAKKYVRVDNADLVGVREDGWNLCWYGEHKDPMLCSNNYRKILLID